MISTKGVPTTAGSKILEGYTPVFDATVAARCKASGLRLLGKTNTDEFAMGSSTENSAYGPTHNPWDPTRVPGGSGGGSAAAVTAGLAPWALGSDTGGSIKQPSALCGNVGLRPTYGTVSRYGVVAFASSLDQVGPVARNVRDCALLYSIIAGPDVNDSTTVEAPPVELPSAEDLKGVRVGVPRELNEAEGIEPGVRAAVQAAIALAESLGAEVDECSLPLSVDYGLPCYYLVAPAEASSNLARYDGVRYGLRSDGADFREMVMNTRHDGFGDEPKRRIMIGTYALSSGYYDAYYGTAQKVRTIIRREHDAAFERFDVLVSPTSPTVAFPLGAKAADPLAMYLSDVLTIPSCMAGLPGLNIPCGLVGRAAGRPAARRAAVLGERAVPRRARARAGDRLRRRARRGTGHERDDAWEPVIGLEIHVQLSTRTKMFCRCPAGYGARREHAHLPGLPRLPGRAAGPEPARRSSGRSGSASRSAARSPTAPSSTARTTSTPTCRRRTRSASTTSRSAAAASLTLPGADGDVEIGIVRAHLEEDAAKTRARRRVGPHRRRHRRRSSTSTAAARRSSRSSPSPTSTTPTPPSASCSCCGRR